MCSGKLFEVEVLNVKVTGLSLFLVLFFGNFTMSHYYVQGWFQQVKLFHESSPTKFNKDTALSTINKINFSGL